MRKQKPNENTNVGKSKVCALTLRETGVCEILTKISRLCNEPDLFIHSFRGVS